MTGLEGGGGGIVSGSSGPGGQGSVVIGSEVPQSAYPAVGIVGNTSDGLNCTGTLVASQYVLTAAHCAAGVGPTQGLFMLDGQMYGTTHVVVHEDYDPFRFWDGYDIAVFRLNQEITGVTPVNFMTEAPMVGETLTLVGYGDGGTTGNPDFDFPNLREGFTELEGVTDQHLQWHFDGKGESNTASGDSGGPAFVERNGELVIAGVTSGGSQDDWWNAGDDSFDTRVDVFADWMQNLLDGNLPEPPRDDHVNEPGPEATPLALDGSGHAVGIGEIGAPGDRDVFQFTVAESTSATISLTADKMAELDTYLILYDSSESLIASHDDIDWPSNSNSRLTRTLIPGTYYASAAAYPGPGRVTGTYVLGVDVDPAAVRVPGDFDGDHDVDGDDFVIWQEQFGTTGPDGDANGDGQVSGDDFLIWQGNYGAGSGLRLVAPVVPSGGMVGGERFVRHWGRRPDLHDTHGVPRRLSETLVSLEQTTSLDHTVHDQAMRVGRFDALLTERSPFWQARTIPETGHESHDRIFTQHDDWRPQQLGRGDVSQTGLAWLTVREA